MSALIKKLSAIDIAAKQIQDMVAEALELERAPSVDKPAITAMIPGEPPVAKAPAILKIPDEVIVKPGQSIPDACQEAKNGARVVTVEPGVHKPFSVKNMGTKPFWLRSRVPGEAQISGLMPKRRWTHVENGVYVTDWKGEPYAGSCNGKMLFRFRDAKSLISSVLTIKNSWEKQASRVKKPEYGFAAIGNKVLVRLPDRADPNTTDFSLTSGFSQTLLHVDKCPNIIIDGFDMPGAGASGAITIERNSPNATIRNNIFNLGKFGAKVSDGCIGEYNEYFYEGFYNFNDDLLDLNNGDVGAVFKLVKVHFANRHGNAHLEGAMFNTHKDVTKGCEFSDNYGHECFDFMRIGQFCDTRFIREVSNYCYDDGAQFESYMGHQPASNVSLEDSLILNSGGSALSHQDKGGQIKGPQHVKGTVIATTDVKHSHPSYALKVMLTGKPKPITYDQCLIHIPGIGKTGWGDSKFCYLDKKGSGSQHVHIKNSIIAMNRIDDWDEKTGAKANNNMVISRKQDKDIEGKGGIYAGSDPSEIFKGWTDLNVAPESLDFAPKIPIKQGPFQQGDKMPWRPMERDFTDEPPKRWEG